MSRAVVLLVNRHLETPGLLDGAAEFDGVAAELLSEQRCVEVEHGGASATMGGVLAAGDRIRYLVTGETVRILLLRKAMRLCGALMREGPAVSLEATDAAIRDRASRADDR